MTLPGDTCEHGEHGADVYTNGTLCRGLTFMIRFLFTTLSKGGQELRKRRGSLPATDFVERAQLFLSPPRRARREGETRT